MRRVAIALAYAASLLACTSDAPDAASDAGASDTSASDASAPDAAPSDAAPTDAAAWTDAGASDAIACGDLATDPANCGRCGHACLGGTCASGRCQPVALATAQGGPLALTLDATRVYWTNYGTDQIMAAGKDGANVSELAKGSANNVTLATSIAVDGQSVYWANAVYASGQPGWIAQCALGGCSGSGRVLVTNLNNPSSIAIDDANVYWSEGNGFAIGRAAKDGSTSGHIALTSAHVDSIAVDGAYVYFCTDDEVARIAKSAAFVPEAGAGAGYDVLFRGSVNGFGTIADDARVYWASNADPGAVQFVGKSAVDAGAATTLASGMHLPLDIALDATNVYWTAYGPNDDQGHFLEGHIFMCPKSGCPASGPVVVAEHLAWPEEIAVDDAAIYWAQRGSGGSVTDGSVMKVAKP